MAIHYNEPLDRAFHALGDGTRRKILSMLAAEGALSASELRRPFDVAQPTVSKHLKVLERAGLIRREVSGRTHRFRIDAASMTEAEDSQPSQIVLSWLWEAPDPLAGVDMQVCFRFGDHADGAEVVVTHQKLPPDTACSLHEDGWERALDSLELFMAREKVAI